MMPISPAAQAIADAVGGAELVDAERPVEVFAREFGDSAINFLVRWWAGSTPAQAHASRDEVVRAIKQALDDAGIEIPFPQRTLWFRGSQLLDRENSVSGELQQGQSGKVRPERRTGLVE